MVRSKVEVWQGVIGFVGITLGVIPLVQKLFTGATGSLWQLGPDGGEGTPALMAALAVVLLAVAAIAVLERRRRS